MKNRLNLRSIATVLNCCAITILGGWIGGSPALDGLNSPHLRYPVTVDSVFKWDSAEWSGRVVVGEYMTGIGCIMCQPHEFAFDSLIQRYPSTAFIALAYHYGTNVPISNHTDSTLWRVYDWYGQGAGDKEHSRVIPYNEKEGWDDWIDGHGSLNEDFDTSLYKSLVNKVDVELHRAPEAVLHLQATPQGGKIVAKVQVTALPQSHSDVYVRMLVVEDTVNLEITDTSVKSEYLGKDRLRLNHYMVVRAASRDAKSPTKYSLGTPLHGNGTISYTFDMAKTQEQRLRIRRLVLGQEQPNRFEVEKNVVLGYKETGKAAFSDKKNWVMDPTRLHLVAFVQDAHTGDVLQAQMIRVNTGQDGKKLLKLPQ